MAPRAGCATALASRASCRLASASSVGTGGAGSAGGQHAADLEGAFKRISPIYDDSPRRQPPAEEVGAFGERQIRIDVHTPVGTSQVSGSQQSASLSQVVPQVPSPPQV